MLTFRALALRRNEAIALVPVATTDRHPVVTRSGTWTLSKSSNFGEYVLIIFVLRLGNFSVHNFIDSFFFVDLSNLTGR